MPAKTKMTEEQMVGLVRNALLVAGQEMGAEGDHWPVIKSTIHNIMKDWEDFRTEREVCVEVKKYYEKLILDLEALSNKASDALKPDIEAAIKEIRALTEACFSKVDLNDIYLSDEEMPIHAKRAEAIIRTLGDNHEN